MRRDRQITLVVLLTARKGREAALERALRNMVRPTRAEPGCVSYILNRSAETRGQLLMFEIWSTPEDLERHRQTPHFKRWKQVRDALVSTYQHSLWKPRA